MTRRQFRPCETAGVDMFPDPDDQAATAEAVAVCEFCPIKQACGDDALARREAFGVWGGLTENRRQSMYRHGRVPAHIPAPVPARASASADRRNRVAALDKQGLPPARIAARLGVSVNVVKRDLAAVRARSALGNRRASEVAARNARIDAMIAAGASNNRICAEVRVGREAVYRRRDLLRPITEEEVAA